MRALLVGSFLALSGCSPGAPTGVKLGDEFRLAPGESVTVASAGMTITFVRVSEDSRCPIDAVCIQAGNGQVELLVRLTGAPDTLTLNTMRDPRGRTFGSWLLRLTALEPSPRAATPIAPADYRARLIVEASGPY